MTYEPFDALYRSTQLDAQRTAMPSFRASFATPLMDQYRAPVLTPVPLKSLDSRAVRNCLPASLNRVCGAGAPRSTIRLAGKQFRVGQTIHMSSKAL